MKKQIEKSRFVSWALRHAPQEIGLRLHQAGWADISQLILCARNHGVTLTESLIRDIVENDPKERYCLSGDGKRIRATYGHSIEVNLGLEPENPPEVLYHGTATRFLDGIMNRGLNAGRRRFVHLSSTQGLAMEVGRRHGRPIILGVAARLMADEGFEFYRTGKDIWLVGSVPRHFLRVLGAMPHEGNAVV